MIKGNIPLTLDLSTDKIAIAYLRVSTADQEKDGTSIESQEEKARRYAEKNHLILDDSMIFQEIKPASTVQRKNIDLSLNQSLKDRPRLQEILGLAQEKKFSHLIVLTRDRLARNFEQFVALQFIFKKNNVTIHYSNEGQNLNTEDEKITRFLDMILANVAELESNIIGTRVRSGLQQRIKRTDGYWPGGSPPFGYDFTEWGQKGLKKSSGTLKIVEESKSKVKEVFDYYKNGLSYSKIAELMSQKYPNYTIQVNGKDKKVNWTKGKIESILKNEIYTGQIKWNRRGGRRNPGKRQEDNQIKGKRHDCLEIIDEDTWKSVINLTEMKSNSRDPKSLQTPFLFKGQIFCGKCGQKLIGKNYGKTKTGKDQRSYKCPTKNKNKRSELVVKNDVVDNLIIDALDENLIFRDVFALYELYCKRIGVIKVEKQTLINTLNEKIVLVNTLRNNITNMINEIATGKEKEGSTASDNQPIIKSKEVSEKINKEISSEESQKQLLYQFDLLERLEFQDTLLFKTKEQYEKERKEAQEILDKSYFRDEVEFIASLEHFYQKTLKMDNNNEWKRILINVVVDKVTITDEPKLMIKELILNPPKIIEK